MIRSVRTVGSLTLIALGFALQASTAVADVTFIDSSFNPADWQLTLIRGYKTEGGPFVLDPTVGNTTSSQQERGGALGAYRRVSIVVSTSTPPNQNFVYGFHHHVGATWDAATMGPIGCVSYTENSRTESSTETSGCQCQGASLGLLQGGVYYIAPASFLTPTAPSGWVLNQQNLLSASDFCAMPGWLDGTCDHPDFSASGTPIKFGFFRVSSNSPGGSTGLTTVAGIDNWHVTVREGPCIQCGDGVDNDGDGCADFPVDLGCTSPTDPTENDAECNSAIICSDTIDNDGDGCTDFPDDLGCTSQVDTSEAGGGCDLAPAVPALSTWGLIALAGVLLGTGVYLLRRAA